MTLDGRPLRVLLVEDEPANRALARAIVGRLGSGEVGDVVLHEAGTIAEARALAATEPLDVVLVDVRLPDGSGLDLVGELRASFGPDALRIVVVSASVLAADRTSAEASGIDGFLGKPYTASDFLRVLRPPARA